MALEYIRRWIKASRQKNARKLTNTRNAVSIDASGPEFHDLHPTQADIRSRLVRAGLFRPEAIDWLVADIHRHELDGKGYQKVVDAIVRKGERLSPDEVKAIGFHRAKIVGRDFASALPSVFDPSVTEKLFDIVHAASAAASQLHSLRRMRDCGLMVVSLSSPGDERATQLETEMDGRKIPIGEAERLTRDRGEEIKRSVWIADVTFD